MARRLQIGIFDVFCCPGRFESSKSLFNSSISAHTRHRYLRRSIRHVGHVTKAPTWGAPFLQEIDKGIESTSKRRKDGRASQSSARQATKLGTQISPLRRQRIFDPARANPMLRKLEEAAEVSDKPRVHDLVLCLVRDFGIPPNARTYTALLHAEADPIYGSAVELGRLLVHIGNDGISLTSEMYHAALKALAVHPHYIFRERLLEEMEQRWFTLDESGWSYVIAALFRERQIELGLERLLKMQGLGYIPPTWLVRFAISTCLNAEAFPDALALLKYLGTYSAPVSSSIWALALSSAAHARSHPLVDYVWRSAVEPYHLNPSSGDCVAVLDTAALNGNFRLASDVFRILGNRDSPLQAYHYEALHESYLNAGDLASAVAVIQLMARDRNITIDDGSLRALVRYLVRDAANRVPHCLALLTDESARPSMPRPQNRTREWNPWSTWAQGPILGACIEALTRVRALDAALQVYWSWDAYHGVKDVDASDSDPEPLREPVEAAPAINVSSPPTTSPAPWTNPNTIPPPTYAVYLALLNALQRLPSEQRQPVMDRLHADARRRGFTLRDGKLLPLDNVANEMESGELVVSSSG